MTKVTALETAVIVNIVALGSSSVNVQTIPNGPEAVKQAQVNAVLLNLKGKGLVAREGDAVSLTEAGVASYAELFPASKDLDTLRHESNLELSENVPMSVEELKLTNQLIEVRKSVNKIGKTLFALQVALISDRLLKEALQEQQLAA